MYKTFEFSIPSCLYKGSLYTNSDKEVMMKYERDQSEKEWMNMKG